MCTGWGQPVFQGVHMFHIRSRFKVKLKGVIMDNTLI